MQIQTIKFTKCKETGEIYGMRTVKNDYLIPDPEKAWKRIKKPGKGWNPQVINDDLVVVDFPDELHIYIKRN